VTKVALALRADGRFLALRADNVSNVGGRCVSLSPLGKGSALVTGSYRIPAASLRSRAVFSHTTPTNAYRSSRRPEVTCAVERRIDKAGGEGDCTPALAGVVSAILDALAPLGVRDITVPVTPLKGVAGNPRCES
jgi:CO/xanthine dehydrogenase Mo-binding subunit